MAKHRRARRLSALATLTALLTSSAVVASAAIFHSSQDVPAAAVASPSGSSSATSELQAPVAAAQPRQEVRAGADVAVSTPTATATSTPTSATATPTAVSSATSAVTSPSQIGTNLALVGPGAAEEALWPAPTKTVSTYSQLVAAINAANPGDIIGLKGGTYSGRLEFTRSGTADRPIVLRPVGTEAVTLTANLSMPSCGARGPDPDRTLTFIQGASHWKVLGMAIRGGIMISGENSPAVQTWFAKKIDAGDWSARRAVPGQSTYDPESTDAAISYLERTVGTNLRPSVGLTFQGNTLTVKGIHARMALDGDFTNNKVTGIACGTGAGIWLTNFSRGWRIRGNDVSAVAASTAGHFMQEGIRLSNASSYNTVIYNLVHDLAPGGRGMTTDQDGSFNLITHNTADNLDIGYNDQMSGWGNRWNYNVAGSTTVAGFSMRSKDGTLSKPSLNSSTRMVQVRCNISKGGLDFQAGAMMEARISQNAFDRISLSKNLLTYFSSAGNTWNGTTTPPPSNAPAPQVTGC